MTESTDVLVVGGGQAGLAMGYELKRAGMRFVLLDAAMQIGDSWRARWDSLRLFTPAEHSGLPGLPFPAPAGHQPARDEVVRYLESYVHTHGLPVRSGQRVLRLRRADDGFEATTATGTYRAGQVVIATGPFQLASRPGFAAKLTAEVHQVHSADYRNPDAIPSGPVVVVGGGNSAVQIAAELAATRPTVLSLGSAATVLPERLLGQSIFWWLSRTGLMDVSVRTPIGRRMSRRQIIIGDSPFAVARKHAVRLVDRVIDAHGTELVTRSGERLAPRAVVWATGYRSDHSWIDAPVLDRGRPVHRRGVTGVPGLYFVGLSWQHTRGSALLGGVGKDARWLARRIAAHGSSAVSVGGAGPVRSSVREARFETVRVPAREGF